MRLDKLIASQGQYSRKEAKDLLKKKQVLVNGRVEKDPGLSVEPSVDKITVAGKPLVYEEFVYYMLHKPAGVVCATEDRDEKTVLDLVPTELSRPGLFPAGRLDKDTTGFVLLTDDGAFSHRILSPKNHVRKTYVASLARPLTPEAIAALEDGILLKDGTRCLPAQVTLLEGTDVRVVICEGKYHQIKRMFAACGNHVDRLVRTHIGNLKLDSNLKEGQCRALTAEEVGQITE